MSKPLEVKTCADCPLAKKNGEGVTYCSAPMARRRASTRLTERACEGREPPPFWCPLRTAPVLVSLKGVQPSGDAKAVLEGGGYQ